ncbi:MAG: hypothetical protein M1831_004524 [Alyxoria varia]|nr:MAG: hypothetical protein M1831_004524 [Alyxoria varia]
MHDCIRREVSERLTALNVPLLYLPSLTTEAPPKSTPHLAIHCTPLSLLPTKKSIIVIMNKTFEDLGIWAYRVLSKHGGIDAGSSVSFFKDVRRRAEIRARKKAVASGRNVKEQPVTPDEIEAEAPGLLILNPGQLLYSYKEGQSMTPMSWDARPRKSAVHPAPKIHSVHNFVPDNRTAMEHTEFVFKHIIGKPEIVSPDAELYLIGVAGDGSEDVIKFLADRVDPSLSDVSFNAVAINAREKVQNDSQTQHRRSADKKAIRDRVAAIALTAPLPINHVIGAPVPLDKANSGILELLAARARAWSPSEFKIDTALENPTSDLMEKLDNAAAQDSEDARQAVFDELDQVAVDEAGLFLCPRVSAGPEKHDECVVPAAYESILDWFEEVKEKGGAGLGSVTGGKNYKNEMLEVSEEVVQAKKDRRVLPDMVKWGPEEDGGSSSLGAGLSNLD